MRHLFPRLGLLLLLTACGTEPESPSTVSAEDLGAADGGSDLGKKDAGDVGTPGPGADLAGAPEAGPVSEDATADTPPPPVDVPQPCVTGNPCDDQDPCTKDDTCDAGACVGKVYDCSDGKACTLDVCDGKGGCTFPTRGDSCLIAGACYKDGDPAPGNPCLACVAPVSTSAFAPNDLGPKALPVGTAMCDDENDCTLLDHCLGGVCVGGKHKDCEDQNPCTDDACPNENGCVHIPATHACDDGDPCTSGDACKGGKCLAGGLVLTCDDGNPCTDDTCLADLAECEHVPNELACDDGTVCTSGDVCKKGVCTAGTKVTVCDDKNPCTDDQCHPKAGCVFPANTLPCDDKNGCTAGDQCQYGVCQPGNIETPCNDANPCTKESCDPKLGKCVFKPDNVAECTDSNPCTIGDFCEAGVCKAGGKKVNCNDDNPCTDDLCDKTGKCVYAPNALKCSDDDPCTIGDHCAAGVCVSGAKPLTCADKNPCTDDYCEAGVGCKHLPNLLECNDGNACTLGDVCLNGQCTVGDTLAACSDANPCTDDQCDVLAGCVHTANKTICSDNDPCTTNDQCQGGQCLGEVSQCDDGNICTKEICLDGGKCDHIAIDSVECRPDIVFEFPPRGAQLLGPEPVIAKGKVTVKGGSVKSFFINGINVFVNPLDGKFEHKLDSRVGLNVIQAIATSSLGGTGKGIRSYAWTSEYVPPGGSIPDGLAIWLSKMVWDDDNTSDIDDIATVMTLLLQSYDIPSLLPNPLTKTSVLGCDYTVKVNAFNIGQPSVDLIPVNGALHVRVRYPNIFVALAAEAGGWFCPDIDGDVSASWIQVDLDLVIAHDPATGKVSATIANGSANVENLDVSLGGILGFLTNWLINFFEGTIADQLEGMVLSQLDIVPKTLAGALESLALNQQFDLPSFFEGQPPSSLTLASKLSSANFNQFGGFLAMSTSIDAGPQKNSFPSPGSVGRAKCLKKVDFFDFLMQAEIEIALKDDMLNQLLFSLWWGGALELKLPKSLLGDVDLSSYGVKINDLSLKFMLPPILSSCNPEEELYLGLGDLWVHASMVLFGQPIEVDAFASGIIKAELVVQEEVDGTSLGISLAEIVLLDVEVGQVTLGFENAKGAIEELIAQNLFPTFLDSFGGKALGGIPIPSIPLDGFSSAVPKGTSLTIDLKKVYRLGGRSVMAGNAK